MLIRVVPLLVILGACTLPPPPETASLPPDAVIGAGDPLRSAIANTSVAFSSPALLAGRPAEAAKAIAQMEWLAVEMPTNPRLTSVSPSIIGQMAAARAEWRAALGIAPDAPAQPVINGLYAAARAISGQQGDPAAALASPAFPQGGQSVLARLAALPSLPLTNSAAVTATDAIRQRDSSSSFRL
jgi:hypothetical protein